MNKLTLTSVALLCLTNIVVLSGVAYNRSGESEASLVLTERELSLPGYSYYEKENSGLSFRIDWNVISDNSLKQHYRRYSLYHGGSPVWLTENKLRELGLNVDDLKAKKKENDYGYQRIDSKEIIVVLEYDGESFKTVLGGVENALKEARESASKYPGDEKLKRQLKEQEEWYKELQVSESRLIAIDAGLDVKALREKYNNKNKFLMLSAELSPYWSSNTLLANIKQIFISDIHVPLPLSNEINAITQHTVAKYNYKNKAAKPRYKVNLLVGKRLEPWIESVSAL